MTTQSKFIRRDPAEVEPWAETCGTIRCLIEASDQAAGRCSRTGVNGRKEPLPLATTHSNGQPAYQDEYIIVGASGSSSKLPVSRSALAPW